MNYHDATVEEKARIRKEAVELRLYKTPLKHIAEKYGVTQASVHKWVAEAVKESIDGYDVETIRGQDALTLDALEANALKLLGEMLNTIDEDGNSTRTLDIEKIVFIQKHILEIHARRAKLFGSDAPQRVLHAAVVRSTQDPEIESLVAMAIAGATGFGGQLMSGPEEVYLPHDGQD